MDPVIVVLMSRPMQQCRRATDAGDTLWCFSSIVQEYALATPYGCTSDLHFIQQQRAK